MNTARPPATVWSPPAVTFLAPALPRAVLQRSRLEAHLGPRVASRLTLVTGPPGSGKTTLTRSWLASITTPWAWMTVDRALAHPVRFWPSVVRAVQLAAPDIVLNAADTVESVGADDDVAIAEALVDDMLRRPHDAEPITVAIDDAHLLDQACWSGIEWVVAHQPPGLHLVIASRSDPPFATARLKALGWMTEVRHTDLVLTPDETAALVERWAERPLPADVVTALHVRTEGWAAGLRLAVMALDNGASADAVLGAAQTARGSLLHELLIAEALEQQPADVRSFLQSTAVLPVVEPASGAAVSGREDSRQLLRRLAADHLFVTAVSDRPDQYRYHPLLADVLRLELRAAGAADAAYDAAARWLEEQGRYAEAIDQALAGCRHELAFRLIVAHLADLYADGHRRDVGRWLLELPEDLGADDPDRVVEHCAALLFVVRPEWLRWLRRARAVVGADRPDLLARLHWFGALASAGQGRRDQFDHHCARAEALDPNVVEDVFAEVITAWSARLATLHGDHDVAVAAAKDLYRRDRALIGELPARSLLAATLHAAGGDAQGADLALDAIAAWRARGEPDYLGMADALVVGTELALVDGDVDEAEVLAASAVGVTDEPPPQLLNVRAEIALAAVRTRTGRSAESQARLQQLRATMTKFEASPPVMALLDGALREDPAAMRPQPAPERLERLTDRELTILGLLTSHLTFPEIGRELYISRHTVKTHVSRIYRKLGASSRTAAIRTAKDLGLM